MNFSFPARNLTLFSVIIVCLNCIALAGTAFVVWIYPQIEILPDTFQSQPWMQILRQFNLGAENNAAAWYSSMLLFGTGLMSFICYLSYRDHHSGKERFFLKGWLIIGFGFMLLSLDELGSIHENAGRLSQFDIIGDNSWESVLAIPGAIVAAFLLWFAWSHLRQRLSTCIFMMIGTVLFASVLLQEHIEFTFTSPTSNPDQDSRPIVLVLLEEGAELFGSWAFLQSMFLYVRSGFNGKVSLKASRSEVQKTYVVVIVLVSLLFLFCFFIKGELTDDEGIIINWFPAASILFTGIMFSCFLIGRARWFVLAYTILLSCYVGVDFYELLAWEDIKNLISLIRIVMIPGLVYFIYLVSKAFQPFLYRICVYLSALFILPAFIFSDELITVGIYVCATSMTGIVVLYQSQNVGERRSTNS